MEKKEIFDILNANPVFHLATCDNGQPRVRGMLLYKADEKGIVFHTSAVKDLYSQIIKNPKAELCFQDTKNNIQIRVSGTLEEIKDNDFKYEIYSHPSRSFLKGWKESAGDEAFYAAFAVFTVKNAVAVKWTFEDNFAPKKEITL